MDDEVTSVPVAQRGVVQARGLPASSLPERGRQTRNYRDLIDEANTKHEMFYGMMQAFDSPLSQARKYKHYSSPDHRQYLNDYAAINELKADLDDLDYWIAKRRTEEPGNDAFEKSKIHGSMIVYVSKTDQAAIQPQSSAQVYNKPSIQATPVQTTVQLSHYATLQEAQLAYYRPMIMEALNAVTKEFEFGQSTLAIVKREKQNSHGSGHFFLNFSEKEQERGAIDLFWRTLRVQQLAQHADNVEIIRVMLRMEGRYAKKDLSDVTILTNTQRAIINSAINASIYHQTASYLQLSAQLTEQVEANKALRQQVVPAANPNSQLTQLQSLANTQEAKIRALEAEIARRNAVDQQVALVPMSSTALVPIDQSTVNPNTTVLIQRIQSLEELVAVLRHNAQQSEKTLAFTQTVLNTSQSHVTTLTETTQNMSATMQMVAGRLSTSTRQATTGELKF